MLSLIVIALDYILVKLALQILFFLLHIFLIQHLFFCETQQGAHCT